MKRRTFFRYAATVTGLCCLPLFCLPLRAQVPIPSEGDILKTLRKEHPRLFVLQGEEERVNKAMAENERLAGIYRHILAAGERILKEPPITYTITQRSVPTLKPLPGRAESRITTLATLYRLTKEKKYLDRAVLEMTTVCEFPDWNAHRCDLDPTIMAAGVGIGYDWLYHDLTPEQRTLFRNAIRDKALLPNKEAYDKKVGWTRTVFNHNQANAGGLTVAALAIADEEPEIAAAVLNRACNSVQIAMTEFAPDGGTREGPGYWSFAVTRNIYLLAALDSALGTDFGLSGLPGFSETGRFRTHFVTPLKTTFTYGDTQGATGASWAMHWLARKFDRPAYAWKLGETTGTAGFAEKPDPGYKAWFDGNIVWSYFDSAYPWTRLGYTYDWGGGGNEYGLSEFLIRKDAVVEVEFTLTTEEFIRRMEAQ